MPRTLPLLALSGLAGLPAQAIETPAESPPAIDEQPIQAALPGDQPPNLGTFRQALDPFGRWTQTEEYGLVWSPGGVAATWRPYSDGRWQYTDQGWAFESSAPWGWATFHYGRWIFRSGRGWLWIPGYVWAPAWVAWRCGGEYVAWAPLGPDGLARGYYDSPTLWLALRAPFFGLPLRRGYFIPTVQLGLVFRFAPFAGFPRPGFYFSPHARYLERHLMRPVRRVPVVRGVPPRFRGGGHRGRR